MTLQDIAPSVPGAPLLELQSITAAYGGIEAVARVDLGGARRHRACAARSQRRREDNDDLPFQQPAC